MTLLTQTVGYTWRFKRPFQVNVNLVSFQQKKLTADLKPYGYYKVPKTNGLWRHETCPISFTLVVNDFGVSYVNRKDAEHLKAALKAHYPMTINWTSDKYIGLTLDWD